MLIYAHPTFLIAYSLLGSRADQLPSFRQHKMLQQIMFDTFSSLCRGEKRKCQDSFPHTVKRLPIAAMTENRKLAFALATKVAAGFGSNPAPWTQPSVLQKHWSSLIAPSIYCSEWVTSILENPLPKTLHTLKTIRLSDPIHFLPLLIWTCALHLEDNNPNFSIFVLRQQPFLFDGNVLE